MHSVLLLIPYPRHSPYSSSGTLQCSNQAPTPDYEFMYGEIEIIFQICLQPRGLKLGQIKPYVQ